MSMELDSEEAERIVRRILSDASPDAVYYVVDVPWEYVFALSKVADDLSDPPTVRLMAERDTLLNLRRNFFAASHAANVIEDGSLAVREREATQDTALIVGEGTVHAPLLLDGVGAHFESDGGTFVEYAEGTCAEQWDAAERFPLRTPALNRVTTTMDADLGSAFRADFEESLRLAGDSRDPDAFEEVTAAILIAANNEALHYDVSKWGEDVDLASKATFSRRKGELEELGVVTTEKVPVDMGRPRQRLHLTDEYATVVAEQGVGELVRRIAG